MRKTFVFLAASALLLGIFAPAEAKAKPKKYKISMTLQGYDYISRGKYKVYPVIDVSRGHEKDFVKISGRVKGGPVKNRSVRISAVNLNDKRATRNLGTVKMSSKGKFTLRHLPPRGGRWRYTVKRAAVGKYKAASKSRSIDAYHWTYLHELNNLSKIDGVTRLSKSHIPDMREYVGPTRWSEEIIFTGDTEATFPTRKYRCKKISVKVGVSNETLTSIDRGTLQFIQGRTTRKTLSMKVGDSPFDSAGSSSAATKFRNGLTPGSDLVIKVLQPTFTEPEHEANALTDLRFIIGNGKVFCTFPSNNTI